MVLIAPLLAMPIAAAVPAAFAQPAAEVVAVPAWTIAVLPAAAMEVPEPAPHPPSIPLRCRTRREVSHDDRYRQLRADAQPGVAVLPAVMQFLHAPPIHIAALLHLLQPGQLRIRLHHRIDGLAHGLLVDVLEVDLQAFHGLDRQVALGDELALAYGFVGLALALRRLPRQVALALLVALLVQVLHRVEGHRAAADDGQVVARFQLRALVSLVAATEQGEVAAAGYLAAHCRHIGDFVAPGLLATEAAFALLVVEVVTAVVGGQQLQLVAGHQVGFVAGAGLARDQPQVLSGIDRQIAASVHASGLLGDLVVLESDLLGLAIGMLFVGSRDQAHIATRLECHVATSVDVAARDADIASGADADIAPRHDLGAHLGRLGLVCLASCRPAPLRYRSRNQDIPAALQGEVALLSMTPPILATSRPAETVSFCAASIRAALSANASVVPVPL